MSYVLNPYRFAAAGADDFVIAEGGTVTTSGDYKLHTFTGDGGFAITNAGTADGSNTFDYAVYGGGAGGGSGSGGGGGGGGYRTATGISSSETTVAVTVGGGGAGNTDQLYAGGDGSTSSYAQAGSQEFFDVSSNGHTITTAGNTAYDTTTKKIGNASIAFDGVSDYLSVATSSDFSVGTGNFTIEGWVRPATSQPHTYAGLFGFYQPSDSSTYGPFLEIYSGKWSLYDGTDHRDTGESVVTETWHHYALVRNGSSLIAYLNGVNIYENATFSGDFDSTTYQVHIGEIDGSSSYEFSGHLDEIRISNVARYTTAFTPVEEPFVADSNTKLLIEPTYTAAGVSTISAGGGGGGGTYDVDDGDGTSPTDGSGGGGATYDPAGDIYGGAGGTGGTYGNDGGAGADDDSGTEYFYPCGGGGGAGGAGDDASYDSSSDSNAGGNGGDGAKPSWLTPLRGGGGGGAIDDASGGGGTNSAGTGTDGGGDAYSDGSAGDDGTANYSGGGGGGSGYTDGGDGGSGIVVFRYKYK